MIYHHHHPENVFFNNRKALYVYLQTNDMIGNISNITENCKHMLARRFGDPEQIACWINNKTVSTYHSLCGDK